MNIPLPKDFDLVTAFNQTSETLKIREIVANQMDFTVLKLTLALSLFGSLLFSYVISNDSISAFKLPNSSPSQVPVSPQPSPPTPPSGNVTTAGGSMTTLGNNNLHVYTNLTDGFKLEYSDNWTLISQDSPDSVSGLSDIELQPKFSKQDSAPDFSVFVHDRSGRTDDQLVKNSIDSDKSSFEKVKLVSSEPILVNNNTAYMYSYTYKDEVYGNAKSLVVLVLTRNNVYDIEYIAPISNYGLFLPEVQKIIDSFETIPITTVNNSEPIKGNDGGISPAFTNALRHIRIPFHLPLP